MARWFATDVPAWILAPEVSYSIFGERGVIDILAWHPTRRALLVIELKSELTSIEETLRRDLARVTLEDVLRDVLAAPR